MFNRDILCINGMVDGLTQNKIYTAIHVQRERKEEYYGLIDDYGIYNLFKRDRFITVTDDLIKNILKYNVDKM